ncbi:MAG TPA: cytochrome c oxidase subunit II, partial [Nakamurella sp.]
MAADSQPTTPDAGRGGPNHGLRIFLIWIVLAIVADLLIGLVLGPHIPPGTMSSSAEDGRQAILVMALMSAPVMVFVLVYFAYALTVWRQRDGDADDGPPIHGHAGIQTGWIVGTSVIVLALAAFGTVELIDSHGAGGGEGPVPIWKPAATVSLTSWRPGEAIQVQVIGQQWKFTYRYPQFGGFETTQLVIPEGQWVQFNVTSIDVIHSFWAYQLGVKADANPNVNNIAFTKPTQLGVFTVRCAELCGLWHGAMFDYGRVVTVPQFRAWALATRVFMADVTKLLPAYATTYDPTVIPAFRSGPVMKKLGLVSAGGG